MNTATDRQIAFINKLKQERDYDPEIIETGRKLYRLGKFDTKAASLVIDGLLASPKIETKQVEVEEGIYETQDGLVYKVRYNREGTRKYASVLTQRGHEDWTFDYAPGAMSQLQRLDPIPFERAAEYGSLYGICVNCARTLTDERSIEAGYGPTCAENNGWPWGQTKTINHQTAKETV